MSQLKYYNWLLYWLNFMLWSRFNLKLFWAHDFSSIYTKFYSNVLSRWRLIKIRDQILDPNVEKLICRCNGECNSLIYKNIQRFLFYVTNEQKEPKKEWKKCGQLFTVSKNRVHWNIIEYKWNWNKNSWWTHEMKTYFISTQFNVELTQNSECILLCFYSIDKFHIEPHGRLQSTWLRLLLLLLLLIFIYQSGI